MSWFKIAFLSFLFLTANAEALPEGFSSNSIEEKKENALHFFITAENYCEFLNQATAASQEFPLLVDVEGASTPNDFYDEKMLGDCIMRTGPPGNYRYDLISGASTNNFNSCITGLSRNDAFQYCAWHNRPASTSTSNFNSCVSLAKTGCDPALRSNTLFFYLKNNSATESVFHDRRDEILSPRNCLVGLLLLIGAGATATCYNERSSTEQNQFGDHRTPINTMNKITSGKTYGSLPVDDNSDDGFQDSPVGSPKFDARSKTFATEQTSLLSNSSKKLQTVGSWFCHCLKWMNPFGLGEASSHLYKDIHKATPYQNQTGPKEGTEVDDFPDWTSVDSDGATKTSPTLNTKGIYNSGVDCYLSSALQTLKTIYQHSSP